MEGREPMPAEYRAWLYGSIVAILAFATMVIGVATVSAKSDEIDRLQKTKQVQACTDIEEGTAAYACVVELDND